MEIPDCLIGFEQLRQAALEHFFSLVLVELRQHERLGKHQSRSTVSVAHEVDGAFLPFARPHADAIEYDFTLRPVLAEKTRLLLSERRHFVVVLLEERRLRVTREIEESHYRGGRLNNLTPRTIL